MTQGVRIEAIISGHPNYADYEYVCIVNHSQNRFKLNGWRLEYHDVPSGQIVHTHNFETLPEGSSFAPGECLRVYSGRYENHWHSKENVIKLDVHTQIAKFFLVGIHKKVVLFDANNTVIDTLSAVQYKNNEELKNICGSPSALHNPILFISHGHRKEWKALRDHLRDKHNFDCIYFESEERAGITATEIIEKLGKTPDIGFFVMTAEDQLKTGKWQARQNVVHELGLLQSPLGLKRAIPLVENGVIVPSNISGTQEIRFTKGRFKETFGDVLAVIRREFGA